MIPLFLEEGDSLGNPKESPVIVGTWRGSSSPAARPCQQPQWSPSPRQRYIGRGAAAAAGTVQDRGRLNSGREGKVVSVP